MLLIFLENSFVNMSHRGKKQASLSTLIQYTVQLWIIIFNTLGSYLKKVLIEGHKNSTLQPEIPIYTQKQNNILAYNVFGIFHVSFFICTCTRNSHTSSQQWLLQLSRQSVGLEIQGCGFDSQTEALELHFSSWSQLGLKIFIYFFELGQNE